MIGSVMTLQTQLRRISCITTLAALTTGALWGCDKSPSPMPNSAAPPPVAAAPAAAATGVPAAATAAPLTAPAAVVQPAAPAPAAAPAHPETCEVEVSGLIKNPPKLPAEHYYQVYMAYGDCLAKDAHILGRTSVVNSLPKFATEVFARWGSDLTLCIAAEAGPGKPTKLYGKATRTFHAEGLGEVEFKDITVEVKAGPPHIFPAVRAPLDGPSAPAAPAALVPTAK